MIKIEINNLTGKKNSCIQFVILITIKKKTKMTIVKICLGSSCFARGNNQILTLLKQEIEAKKLNAMLEIVGCRCSNLCADGPNVFVDEKKYTHVTAQDIPSILESIHG